MPSGELTETVSRLRQLTDGLTVSLGTVSRNRQLGNRQLDRQLMFALDSFPGSEVVTNPREHAELANEAAWVRRWNDLHSNPDELRRLGLPETAKRVEEWLELCAELAEQKQRRERGEL